MTVGDSLDPAVGDAIPLPAWVERSLSLQEGRDPLGLQTTTQDRLMPLLLPGILELSRRARYFSFHAFLLAEYQRERQKPDSKVLSMFIKRAEWDFGLAVQRCPQCTSGPVGARRLAGLAQGPAPVSKGRVGGKLPRRVRLVLPLTHDRARCRRRRRHGIGRRADSD